MTTSFSILCPIDPTCPIWVLYLIPMAWKRHQCSTDLALVTFLRLADLNIFYFMSNCHYIPNLGSLPHSHGLAEALEAHGCGHGYQGEGVRGPWIAPGIAPGSAQMSIESPPSRFCQLPFSPGKIALTVEH